MINWRNPGRNIILASASPRRKQILSQMGFVFDVKVGQNIDENSHFDTSDLNGSLKHLASVKARGIAQDFRDSLVIGADTVVVRDNIVLGKPQNREEAYLMLKELSGKRHTVKTGVALVCNEISYLQSSVTSTDVHFRNITDEEIHDYLDTNEYQDKAGAYAIQGRALIFVESIQGCYYNVVGLPVSGTISLFKDFIARKESANV
jgi:septum formation protein